MSTNASTCCESWGEEISLLAAGCLSPDAEQAVRRHIANCGPCQTEFDQVSQLCQNLNDVPSVNIRWADSVVANTMTEITRPQNVFSQSHVVTAHREHSRGARSELFAVVCIAAVLLVSVGWTLSLKNPQRAEIAHRPRTQPTRKDVSALQPVNAVVARNHSMPPTMLELRNAFAQSDDKFDSLLAQQPGAAFPALADIRSLDESL
ncbi:MAG: zf-HC2 domain-containing protein [Planctomycetota bacterium]